MTYINKKNEQTTQVNLLSLERVRVGAFILKPKQEVSFFIFESDGITSGDFGSARRNDTGLYGEEPIHILTFFWGPAVWLSYNLQWVSISQ